MTNLLFKRIDTVFLPVTDLTRAIDWYVDTLGVELLWRTEGVACLKLGETPLTLLQHGFPGYDFPPEGHLFQPMTEVPFNFYTPDILAAHKAIAASGATVSEINDYGEVQDFTFIDPDGNRLGVCWWPE